MKSAFLFGGTADLLSFVQPSALVDYQFRLQGSLTNYGSVGGSLTTTRSGNGTFIGSNGLLQTAGTNVARFDFDPVSLTRRGLLFEGQATNLLRNSSDFANATYWTRGFIPIADNVTSIDGATNADTLPFSQTGAAAGGAQIYQKTTNLAASTSYVASIYLKEVTPGFRLKLSRTNGSTWNSSVASNEITLGSSWVRYSLQFTTNAGETVADFLIGSENKTPYPLPATGSAAADRAQLEIGTVPTSHVPTTTAAATRFADAASMAGLPTAGVTLVEKPAGCATLSAGNLTLNTGYTIDRIMVLPGTYSADQITTIRGLM
jgi:hypothetical protein